MSDLKDIWTADEGSQKLSEEQLTAYLEGRLSAEERHAVESLLATEGMESDALEGLQNFTPQEAQGIKQQLNADLQRALSKKRRSRRGMASQQWTMTSIIVLLLLIVMCFAVFWMIRHR